MWLIKDTLKGTNWHKKILFVHHIIIGKIIRIIKDINSKNEMIRLTGKLWMQRDSLIFRHDVVQNLNKIWKMYFRGMFKAGMGSKSKALLQFCTKPSQADDCVTSRHKSHIGVWEELESKVLRHKFLFVSSIVRNERYYRNDVRRGIGSFKSQLHIVTSNRFVNECGDELVMFSST